MIQSHADAVLLLERLQTYGVTKRILNSGVGMKAINSNLSTTSQSAAIRKQVKAYCTMKFPSANIRLATAGPKVSLTERQSAYIHFINNGSNREAIERRRVIEYVDGVKDALGQLQATIRSMYGRVDLVRDSGTTVSYSVLVRCTQNNLSRSGGSTFDNIGLVLTSLDTFKGKLDALMLLVPDLDAAYTAGLAIKAEREAELAKRRIVDVQNIINMFAGRPAVDRIVETAEMPPIPMPNHTIDIGIPTITEQQLNEEGDGDEQRPVIGFMDVAADRTAVEPRLVAEIGNRAVGRPNIEAMIRDAIARPVEVGEDVADPLDTRVEEPTAGWRRAVQARPILFDTMDALGAIRARPANGGEPVVATTRPADDLAQAQLDNILRGMGHNVN